MIRKLIVLVSLCLPATAGQAAIYYVDSAYGPGGNGTEPTPWDALADLPTLATGDTVRLKCGSVFRESLSITAANVTVEAYGTGDDPVIIGSDLVTDWEGGAGGEIFNIPLNADGYYTARPEANYRTILDAEDFTGTAAQIRLTLVAHNTQPVHLYGCSIGPRVGTSDDFDGTPTRVTFSSADGVMILAGTTVTSDWITVDIEAGTDYLIHYWIDSPTATHYYRYSATTGGGFYRVVYSAGGGTDLTMTPTVNLGSIIGEGARTVLVTTIEGAGSGDVWSAALTTEPGQVFFDGTRGTKETATENLDVAGEWYWSSNVLYTYSSTDPDTAYADPGVEACWRPTSDLSGLLGLYADGVTVRNLSVQQSDARGIDIKVVGATADNVTVSDCTVEWSRLGGIVAPGGLATALIVEDCNVAYNNTGQIEGTTGHEAITAEGTNGFTIRRNRVHHNYREGIDAKYGATGGLIYQNLCYANGYTPTWQGIIQIYLDGATSTDVYQNFIYGGDGAPQRDQVQGIVLGIENDSYPTTGIRIWGNVIHHCSEGVRFWTAGGITAQFATIGIVGNTMADCSTAGVRFASSTTGRYGSGIAFWNNLLWHGSAYAILDDTTENGAIAACTINTNGFLTGGSSETYGTNSVQAAVPGFTDQGSDDYTLTAGSPFRDAGAWMSAPYNVVSHPASVWPAAVLDGRQTGYLPAYEMGAFTVCPSQYQDFAVYTFVNDAAADLYPVGTILYGWAANDTGAYAVQDFGAAYFADDFSHRWQWFGLNSGEYLWTLNQKGYLGWTDTAGSFNSVTANAASHSAWLEFSRTGDTQITAVLRVYSGTTQEASDTTTLLATQTWYYFHLTRTGGTLWTVAIRTASQEGPILDTLTVNAASSPAYRYLQPWTARSDQTGNSAWEITYYETGAEGGGANLLPLLNTQHLRRRP